MPPAGEDHLSAWFTRGSKRPNLDPTPRALTVASRSATDFTDRAIAGRPGNPSHNELDSADRLIIIASANESHAVQKLSTVFDYARSLLPCCGFPSFSTNRNQANRLDRQIWYKWYISDHDRARLKTVGGRLGFV